MYLINLAYSPGFALFPLAACVIALLTIQETAKNAELLSPAAFLRVGQIGLAELNRLPKRTRIYGTH